MNDLLLDTNVVSEAFRPQPHPGVLQRLGAPGGRLFLPALAWHELRFGADRLAPSSRRDALEEFLALVRESLTVLPYDEPAAAHHARERARLAQAGRTPSFVDGAIAAIAVTRGLTLVTRNVTDFKGFLELRVEDWFA
jgi:tRNA(fMet)-specific endonuclease VapC